MAISLSKSGVTPPLLLCVYVCSNSLDICLFFSKKNFLRKRIYEVAFDSSYRRQLKLICVTAIGISSKFYSDRKYEIMKSD